jgi:predicted 3-demethylubiquinone-9 3-methyltransferase (glyoxalase superfamily)
LRDNASKRYGGPYFKFTEAISLSVSCGTQAELDGFWERLSEGGEQGQCGWLKDKFGLSWQIVPSALGEMMQDQDAGKTTGHGSGHTSSKSTV